MDGEESNIENIGRRNCYIAQGVSRVQYSFSDWYWYFGYATVLILWHLFGRQTNTKITQVLGILKIFHQSAFELTINIDGKPNEKVIKK